MVHPARPGSGTATPVASGEAVSAPSAARRSYPAVGIADRIAPSPASVLLDGAGGSCFERDPLAVGVVGAEIRLY